MLAVKNNKMLLFCRVSLDYGTLAKVFEVLQNETDVLVVYEHEADEDVNRTHVHFLIDWVASVDTLKNRFKINCTTVTFKGNSSWSFLSSYKPFKKSKEVPVNEDCITYMSKGELEPVVLKGFTQDLIAKYKDRWVERTPETSYQPKLTYVTRETPSEAKKRKNDLIKEMLDRINIHDGKYDTDISFSGNRHLLDVIIQVLNENKVVFSRYTIRDYYDTILARTNPSKFIDALSDMLKFSR